MTQDSFIALDSILKALSPPPQQSDQPHFPEPQTGQETRQSMKPL